MRLMTLATWGCRVQDSIFDYIKDCSETVDIFCFQEILKGGKGNTGRAERKSGYEDICEILPNHTGYFSEYGEGGYFGESSNSLDFKYGIACFVKNDFKQSFAEDTMLYDLDRRWNDYSGRFAVGKAMVILVEDYAVINIHGIWQGGIKGDTEAKIEQSKKILDLANMAKGRRIACGDFNLLPNTKSLQMIGDRFIDLVKEYKIKNTRSSFYTKELRFADYVFVDRDIKVKDFSVSDLEVSDHLPLVVEFN